MAKVMLLAGYARLSRGRASQLEESGATRLLELCIAAVLVFVFSRLIWLILAGPSAKQVASETTILTALGALWLFVPATARTHLSSDVLLTFPLTRWQRISFAVVSFLSEWRITLLVAASGITVLSLSRTSAPTAHMARASGFLLVASAAGTGLALAGILLRKRGQTRSRFDQHRLLTHRGPVLRKELRYLLRTLDPWLALLLSAAAAWTEFSASWMTPGKAIVPLLLIGLLQSASLLNPFALDSKSEMERYRIMPTSLGSIIGRKHLASALVMLLTALPLFLACIWRMSWSNGLRTFVETGLVVSGSLLSVMLLMRTRSARMIRMEFWKLSGDGANPVLFISAGILTATPAFVSWLIQSRMQSPAFGAGISVGLISLILLVYANWLNRLKWRSERG